MDFERHQSDLRMQRKANRTLGSIIVLQSLCLLIALGGLISLVGSERTILVPPSIDKTFWVTKDKASGEYLEQMAGFITWLMLDVSPGTVDWKRDQLLKYVPPAQYQSMKTKMDLEADRLRRNNASTSFLVQQFTADEKDQSVLITGRLRRQINGADVGEPETRSYLAQFQYTGGRVHIQTFKEISNAQPGQVRVGAADSSTVAR